MERYLFIVGIHTFSTCRSEINCIRIEMHRMCIITDGTVFHNDSNLVLDLYTIYCFMFCVCQFGYGYMGSCMKHFLGCSEYRFIFSFCCQIRIEARVNEWNWKISKFVRRQTFRFDLFSSCCGWCAVKLCAAYMHVSNLPFFYGLK